MHRLTNVFYCGSSLFSFIGKCLSNAFGHMKYINHNEGSSSVEGKGSDNLQNITHGEEMHSIVLIRAFRGNYFNHFISYISLPRPQNARIPLTHLL